MSDFEGFPQVGLDFLTELGSQDKEWFTANKATYQAEVVAPAKAFVETLGQELQARVSASIEAQPKTNGSIAPINNDLRFSPDASPYKDHLMFRFWEADSKWSKRGKKAAPTLMLRVSPTDGVGFATGIALPDLATWRKQVANKTSGQALDKAVAKLAKTTKADVDVVGQELKKVPKPYDQDHPRGDLLKHKALQIRWIDPTPKSITKPSFIEWCASRFERTGEVHSWLCQNL